MIRIGTAGWSLPSRWQDRFPEGDTHLHRYAGVLGAVEIDRTFRKTPRPSTFARWADSVPGDFRFSVKLPREITHDRRLEEAEEPLEEFLEPVAELGDRLGPLLIQLPPSLAFEVDTAARFLEVLRGLRPGPDVLEPRHESWFIGEAGALLAEHRVARAAADPPRADDDGRPGGWGELAYFRLHGRPRTYYSAYRQGGDPHLDDAAAAGGEDGEGPGAAAGLDPWIARVRAAAETHGEVWCVFDNTAAGEGTGDALAAVGRLRSSEVVGPGVEA